MSQLETNTISLQTLLDKVNALPEAGSGGGGEMKTATGTFTPTASDIYTTPVTVTGLGFKPKVVCIQQNLKYGNDNTATPTTYPYNVLKSYISGEVNYGTRQYTTSSTKYYINLANENHYIVTMNDDGFTISGVDKTNVMAKAEYNYYAIG